jgi:hypothetical protein
MIYIEEKNIFIILIFSSFNTYVLNDNDNEIKIMEIFDEKLSDDMVSIKEI